MRTLALLLSLLALGALGLVACEVGDDETTTGSEAEATRDEHAAGSEADPAIKSCGDFRIAPVGAYPLIKVEVVEGDVPCRVARRVLRGQYRDVPVTGRTDPGTWFCSGPEGEIECRNETGDTIGAHFAKYPEQRIERTANKWAALFAAAHDLAAGRYETQPLGERIACNRHGEPIENCTPPSSAFRESFADATVQDVAIRGGRAGARFSNGETVELVRPPGRGGVWLIDKLGGSAGDVLAVENRRCGRYDRYRVLVEGEISCAAARRVVRGMTFNRLPASWICNGSDALVACTHRARPRAHLIAFWGVSEAVAAAELRAALEP